MRQRCRGGTRRETAACTLLPRAYRYPGVCEASGASQGPPESRWPRIRSVPCAGRGVLSWAHPLPSSPIPIVRSLAFSMCTAARTNRQRNTFRAAQGAAEGPHQATCPPPPTSPGQWFSFLGAAALFSSPDPRLPLLWLREQTAHLNQRSRVWHVKGKIPLTFACIRLSKEGRPAGNACSGRVCKAPQRSSHQSFLFFFF